MELSFFEKWSEERKRVSFATFPPIPMPVDYCQEKPAWGSLHVR